MGKERPALGPAFNVALWVAVVVWALASLATLANQLTDLFGVGK